MGWKDNLRPASFRGVPFFVEGAERSGGRRGVTHEFPFRRKSFREGLGKSTVSHRVDCYVIGRDYMQSRDALLAALESDENTGPLVHPYLGALTVAVAEVTSRETVSDGGIARFSVEFIETEEAPAQPVSTTDFVGQLVASSINARAAVRTEFLAQYNPGPQLGSVTMSLMGAATSAQAAASKVAMSVQGAATLRRQVDQLLSSASQLANTPGDMFASLAALFSSFDVGAFRAVLGMYSFSPGPRPDGTTVSRAQEQVNFDATVWLTQRLAVIRSAELVTAETFDTYESAVSARRALLDVIDEQAELVADGTYPALQRLRADLVALLPGADSDLPRLRSVVLLEATPSLVVSYNLFGSLDQEADVIARNGVSHPGFVPGGAALTVRTDG